MLTATLQSVGLFAAAFVIPVLGQIVALFTPVPLILAMVRTGRRDGLLVLGFAGLLTAALGGWQAAAVFLLSFGLMAIGIAESMRRNSAPERTALLGGLLPVMVSGLLLAFYFLRMGKDPLSAIETYLHGSISEAAKMYSSMGMTEMSATVNSVSDRFLHYLVRLIPGITIATSLIQSACCYGLAQIYLSRDQNADTRRQPTFALWHAPDSWVWGLIAALALVLTPSEPAKMLGWNAAIIFVVVYVAQGSAMVDFYLQKARIRLFFRMMIITLLLALPSLVFVIALGVVDIWADPRKIRTSPPQNM